MNEDETPEVPDPRRPGDESRPAWNAPTPRPFRPVELPIRKGVVDTTPLAAEINAVTQGTVEYLATRFSGPVPPPDLFEHYERILPGSANRLLAMAEAQQTHAHAMAREEAAIARERLAAVRARQENDFKLLSRGQLLGALIALAVMAVGLIGALNDHPVFGGVLIGGDLLGLVAIFVLGRPLAAAERPSTSGEPDADEPEGQGKHSAD